MDQIKVSIKEEMNYLHDYIDLQRIRVKDRCEIDFIFDIKNENIQIAPLMLIVLLENSFKHGVDCSDTKSWIKVILNAHDDKIYFECQNSIPKDHHIINKSNNDEVIGGVGIENLKRRLELLYKGKYDLTLKCDKSVYCAQLKLENE